MGKANAMDDSDKILLVYIVLRLVFVFVWFEKRGEKHHSLFGLGLGKKVRRSTEARCDGQLGGRASRLSVAWLMAWPCTSTHGSSIPPHWVPLKLRSTPQVYMTSW